MELNKKIIVICSILLLFAISAYAVTQHVYIGTNYHQQNLTNISTITADRIINFSLVVDSFNNENFTTRYDLRIDRFLNANFTSRYDARTDRFLNANFTTLLNLILPDLQNVSAVYNSVNFTSNYDARTDRFLNENFTSGYDARTDRFLNENFTSRYDARTDRFGNENTTSFLLGWTNLTNYPAACPANTYVSTLGDSVTCTATPDNYVFDGGDNITGNYNHTSGNFSHAENGTSCYGWSCQGQIYYNGSALVIKVT